MQTVLRHVALKSFKNEISTLKTKIHHVSLERDKLKSSLNRTMEEKQKLIAEGDEHVEMVTKKSERKIKYVSLIEKGGEEEVGTKFIPSYEHPSPEYHRSVM